MKHDPLPSCARRHPDIPSQIVLSEYTYRGQEKLPRRYCRVCKQMIVKEQEWARSEIARKRGKSPTNLKPYGVIPLNWPAPEGSETDTPCR